MAVFDPKSRYVTPPLEVYSVVDRRGREVKALPMVEPPRERSVGEYVTKQGQRIDHLANYFLLDPHGYCASRSQRAPRADALEEVEA